MPVMIYTKQKANYTNNDDDYYIPTTKRLLFTDPVVIVEQLSELADEILNRHYDYEWNDRGDEYAVHTNYAQACMDSENLFLHVKKLFAPYSKVQDSIPYMPSDFTSWYSYVRGCGIDGEDWCEDIQERHPAFMKKYRDAVEASKILSPRGGSYFVWHDTDQHGGYIHRVHIITRMSGDFFDHEQFDAVDKTLMQMRIAEEDAEMERWLKHSKTDEYKQEQAERAQEQRDLATYIGENGHTSFVANDDGTYTTWR